HSYPHGVSPKHKKLVQCLGQIGFVTKGVVYGVIGGLCCTSALQARSLYGSQGNASPQGAFLLLGGADFVGRPILIILAIGLAIYATWRFWEASVGQNWDPERGKIHNFFSCRLSPFVSGGVYTAYLYMCVEFAIKDKEDRRAQGSKASEWPSSWNNSWYGRMGIVLIGIAFLAATLSQLDPAIRGTFRRELKTSHYPPWIRHTIHIMGRIGFLARAGTFLAVAVMMFKSLNSTPQILVGGSYTVATAFDQFLVSTAGKVILFILGIGLIIYGLFAVGNAYFKYFPTASHPYDPKDKVSSDSFIH
ncbi:MAG: hypothetical protein DHS80DRAFT_4866, partial [Piptocephalis tieghemiana]